MIVRVHNRGYSFVGAAKYILHDLGHAQTDGRVAWTDTRNLATRDPDVAARVMAATAMDQHRLKKEAGIRATGRKPKGAVLHYTLSWNPEEADTITREEMLRAVDGSLAALGKNGKLRRQYADEHQALIVCHNDEEHPHVHIIVNCVHPEHGVMLPTSQEWEKLSRWAGKYVRDRGKDYCPNREANAKARKKGGQLRGNKNKPRDLYELEKKYGKNPYLDQIRKEQRVKDRQLGRRTRQTKERHRAEWDQLRDQVVREKEAIGEQSRQQAKRGLAAIKKDFEPRWRKLLTKQRRDLVEFGKREKQFVGRIQNALAGLRPQSILQQNDRVGALRAALRGITSRDARLEALKKAHLREAQRLQARERQAAREAVRRARISRANRMSDRQADWLAERDRLVAAHQQEKTELREAWRARKAERQKAWKEKIAERDFNLAARNVDPRERVDGGRSIERPVDTRRRPGRGDDFDRGR